MNNYDNEIWAPIPDYDNWEVSTCGRVRNKRTGHITIGSLYNTNDQTRRYRRVALYQDGQRRFFKVHRLVAMVFIPNPENKPEINHIDRDGSNNRVENLEWVTHQENMQKLKESGWVATPADSIKVLCVETGEIFESIRAAARAKKINKNRILDVFKGSQKTAGKLHWEKVLEE